MSVIDNSDYVNLGFVDRNDYLEGLCEQYPRDQVYNIANLLGSSEDFDGLVTTLENLDQ